MHVAPPHGPRVGVPAASELSRQAWVGEAAAACLPECVRAIQSFLASQRPRAIFLGGSAVHGELCGIVAPDGTRRILSDLDIGVLAERRAPAGTADAVDRLLAEISTAPEVRVGLYCLDDLGRQDPTPGMVETARAGWVLFGRPGDLARFVLPAPDSIPAWEARRLLANRAIEWLEALGSASPTARAYAAAKLTADSATVALLARGLYRGGGYAARAAEARRVGILAPAELDRVEAWTAWRLEPDWDRLPVGGGDLTRVEASGAVHAAARQAIVEGLRHCGEDAGGDALFRDVSTSPRKMLRSWKRWLSGGGNRRFPGPGLWDRTPRNVLWEAAVWFSLGRFVECRDALARLVGAEALEPMETRIVGLRKAMDREGIE